MKKNSMADMNLIQSAGNLFRHYLTSIDSSCRKRLGLQSRSTSTTTVSTAATMTSSSSKGIPTRSRRDKDSATSHYSCNCSIDEMPSEFHEPFILSGYRIPNCSIKQCLLSSFRINNETMNFWTHFLPVFYFLYQFFIFIYYYWEYLHSTSYYRPMMLYLFCLAVYPLTSSVAHLFNVMSVTSRHCCFFLDYGALALYSFSCAMAYRAYSFPRTLDGGFLCSWYIPLAFLISIGCVLLSSETRFLPHSWIKKLFRCVAFATPYFFVSVPVFYRVFVDNADEGEQMQHWPSTGYHKRQIMLAVATGILYSWHIPERFFPGKFDIIGHSHQLFHLIAIWGTIDQMTAISLDLEVRRERAAANGSGLSDHLLAVEFDWSVTAFFAVAFINMAIIVAQTLRMRSKAKTN